MSGQNGSHPTQGFHAGDTWPVLANFFDKDGVTPLDLTGSGVVIEWGLMDIYGVRKIYYNSTSPGTPIHTTSNPGQVSLLVAATDTAPLTPGTFSDQLRVTQANGEISTQIDGIILVKKSLFA